MSSTKVQVARGLIATHLTISYYREMNKNIENENWAEAGKDTAFYALSIAPILYPEYILGRVYYPVLVGTALGVAATFVVTDALGMNSEPFAELVFDTPITEIPGKYIATVAPPTVSFIEEQLQFIEEQTLSEIDLIEKKAQQTYSFGSFLYRSGEQKVKSWIDTAKKGLPSFDYGF